MPKWLKKLAAPSVLIVVTVNLAIGGIAGGTTGKDRVNAGGSGGFIHPTGKTAADPPSGPPTGSGRANAHRGSTRGTGYLTVFQEATAVPLSVSIDGSASVVLTNDDFNYGLISSGSHSIAAKEGRMTVASGTVVVPAGEHVTAVIYLSSDGSVIVTGFNNHRSIPPVDQSQLVLRNTADAPPVDVYLDGTKVASGLSNDPSSPKSASILTTKGPATIAATRVGAPLGQALVLQHVELGAGELVDMFLVGNSTHHPSTLGLIADTIPLGVGYRLYASDGGVFDFGDADFFGSTGGLSLHAPVTGAAPTSSGGGYWLVGADGGVFSFGDAAFFGSAANVRLDKPIVGMAGDPDDAGYWLVAGDGGVLTSGSAPFYGSMAGLPLKRPIVGMAATPDGRGYWLVASDGGVFSFGDAAFYGSTGAIDLNKPIVAIVPTIDGRGYWLVASDGGVFSFGDATFYGSTGGTHLDKPVVAAIPTPDSLGYWLVASDGGVFSFGDATFFGSTGGTHLNRPIVAGSAPALAVPS